ncbi:hypothetical protein C1T17_00745 [Sphingobium sp. SCG-1]|uniref:hypothetical protein n=1 Tax=Sphingobium sp. SCG-1 TaxID=2072936 RepID=UPI000CD6BFB0|nr:hypothetical protein [Sphingobium sp. SCG-1]AUW56821.1 hypothetical protein C1T17_00745 [Sphingobium sp. SCG-1]
MNIVALLKATGYLISTISVLLLGVVAWDGAKDEPALRFCLIAGVAASVIGMALRWLSFRHQQREAFKS